MERAVINKERLSSSYRLSAYILSKTISELPENLVFPGSLTVLTYFCVGLTRKASNFFIILGTIYLMNLIIQVNFLCKFGSGRKIEIKFTGIYWH